MIADWLNSSGLAIVKPVLTALVLPPVPFVALALLGALLSARRHRAGAPLVAVACVALWLGSCGGCAAWIQDRLLHPPPALSQAQRDALKARAAGGEPLAIVVLGGGVEAHADEYGTSDLASTSLQRLRYGLWLGKLTGIPVGMSGGLGWAAAADSPQAEATVGARIAAEEFGQPLRWREATSRDTHENARNTVALLAGQGVRTIVLVTSAWHMPRSLREFEAAAAERKPEMAIVAAPMAFESWSDMPSLAWIPSTSGFQHTRETVRELLGALLAPDPGH